MCKLIVPGDKFGALGEEFIALDIDKARGNILCIRTGPWRRASFDERTERECTNNFAEASIRNMLSHVYFSSMLEMPEDKDYFVRMAVDIVDNFGCHDYAMIRDYVRLLTQQEMVQYSKYLDIEEWAWTMTPLKCRRLLFGDQHIGDQSVTMADSRGRWGHKKACYPADIYPVVMFRQRITRHPSFYSYIKRPI